MNPTDAAIRDAGFRAGLRRAAEIMQDEKVDAHITHAAEDEAYNLAIEHCTAAILKEANK